MSGYYKFEETRLVQIRIASSAANADACDFSAYPVPLGKLWIVTGFAYTPSVAETQTVSFVKRSPAGIWIGLLNPTSMNLNPAVGTFIEQGMEYLLMPGEYLAAYRVTHTAGSSMAIYMQFIEIDQPLYTYDEPQIVQRQKRALSSIRTMMGGGSGSSGGATPPPSGSRTGGRGGLPV